MKSYGLSLSRLSPVLFILALLLAACQQRGRHHAQLAHIDTLADVRPAEADSLLLALAPAMPSATKADSMHYALMRLKTDDKLYRPITDRQPLAQQLVGYYEHHSKGTLLPTALFYAGRVSADLGDAPQALEYYQHGLLLTANSDDEKMKNSFHKQMGYIFLNQDLFDDAMRQFLTSYESTKQQKDTIGMIYNLRDIAQVCEFQRDDVRADSFYQKSYQLAVEKGDVSLVNMVLLQLASLHRRQRKTEQAIKEIRPSLLNMDTASISAIYSIASRIYMDAKKTDSARLFLDKLLVYGNVYGKQCAHLSLMELDAQDGNVMSSLRHLKQYRIYEDSVHRMNNASVVKRMNAMYNYQKYKQAYFLSEQEKQKAIAFFSILLIVLVATLIFGGYRYKVIEREARLRFERLQLMEKEHRQLMAMRENASSNPLNEEMISVPPMEVIRETSIYKRIHELQASEDLFEKKLTPEEWQELEREINVAWPLFEDKLYSLYPNLNARQLQVCLLTKIEVKPKMVAEFVQLTEQGVGSLKRRLYEKTFKKKGGTKDFDQSILLI